MATKRLPPWLRPKQPPQPMRIGVTWYTEQEWRLVRDAASDAERLEASYAEWVAMAEEATKDMLAAGIVAERVFINASELLAWCLAHGKQNDAAARSEYVSQCLMKNRQGAS